MDITGRLIQLMPKVEGDSARGHWVRGGFVIETDGDYPRKVAFTTFGEDRASMADNIPLNSMVQVSFTPESREFNERWYTDLRCSRIQPFVPGQMPQAATGYTWNNAPAAAATSPAAMPPAQPAAVPQPPQPGFASAPASAPASDTPYDDLPF